MKLIFWIGVVVLGVVMLYYLYQAWVLYSGRSKYIEVYPEMYREVLVPAAVAASLFIGALMANFWFKSPKIALYIVLSPLIVGALALIFMVIASMFIRDWR
ncbi:MAG: hypothetical protein U0X91_01590 [Spirosomataceae bacterium]